MKNKLLVLLLVIGIVVLKLMLVGEKEVLTPEELLADKDFFLDKNVTVKGIANIGSMICTLLVCPETNPCCNACGGNLILEDKISKITIIGNYQNKSVGCSGDNCKQICYPLDKGKMYKVSGIWKKEYDEYYLYLTSFQQIGG